MALLPQARPDGLSAIAGQPRSSQAWLGVAVAFAIALGFAGLSDVLVAICVTAVVVTAVATIAKRQIGGQTGDVLGAVAQVAESRGSRHAQRSIRKSSTALRDSQPAVSRLGRSSTSRG